MKYLLILNILILNAFSALRIGTDKVEIGQEGSQYEKTLKLGDQFHLLTSSTTGEVLLSVNSGADFSPLLTASTGGGGGGSGIITGTASPSTDRAVVIWDGTSGASLTQSDVLIDAAGNISGVASLTMSASLTIGTASSYLYVDSNSNLKCSGDAGTNTTTICGPDAVGGGGADVLCYIRMDDANGYAASYLYLRRFGTLTTSNCPSGGVTLIDDVTNGSIFVINTDGLYFIHCSDSLTGSEGMGLVLNTRSNGYGTTDYAQVPVQHQLGGGTQQGINASVGASVIRRFTAGDEINCHNTQRSTILTTNTFFYIEQID